ncbi:MAG: aspartate aminotransferase family protein [Spirochaetota bacterium]
MSDFFMDTYKRTGLVFSKGKGARLETVDGVSYIDFASGIGVNSLGHGHPRLVAAIAEQAGRLIHVSNYYNTETSQVLARELCGVTGYEAVFFCNSGAEANEGAIKIARKHGASIDPKRTTIVTLLDSFHGRTIAALAATGQEKFHKNFGPFPPGFVHVRPNDIDALRGALDETVCALLLEPVQGEGGVLPLTEEYLRAAEKLCRDRDILFIADEVQCGMGRTGAWLASGAAGTRPDVAIVAKGLGGGVPIGAILARGAAAKVLGRGDHGSTFGGNPLAAAAARVVLEELRAPGFLESVTAKGAAMMAEIAAWKHPLVKEVRGRGLMMGVVTTAKPDQVKELAMAEGLLILTAGEDVIRLLPPLIIGEADIKAGLIKLKVAFDRALSSP